MVNSNSFYKSFNIDFNGIEYTFCMNNDSVIFFISTKDPKFESCFIRVGCNIEKINNYVKHEIEPGWANFYTLNSNWSAAYMDGDSKVVFFFKRDLTNYLLPRN